MYKILPSLLLLGVSVIFYGCHKSSSDTIKELLTSSGWKYANYEKREVIDNVPKPWVSHIDDWGSCIKDNITMFKSDGTFEEKEGATKCGVGFPDVFGAGNWSLMSNDTQLKVDAIDQGMLGNANYDITVLGKNTFQLTTKGQFFIPGGTSGYEELRWTYHH